MKKLSFVLTIIAISFFAFNNPMTPEEKGLEIAKSADMADQGFESVNVELTMTLKNKNGQTSVRNLSNSTLEQTVDGDKSLIVFKSPKDVLGTAILTYTHKEGSDD